MLGARHSALGARRSAARGVNGGGGGASMGEKGGPVGDLNSKRKDSRCLPSLSVLAWRGWSLQVRWRHSSGVRRGSGSGIGSKMSGTVGKTGETGPRTFGIAERIGGIGATSVGWPTDGRMFGIDGRTCGTGARTSETGVKTGGIGGPAGVDRPLVPTTWMGGPCARPFCVGDRPWRESDSGGTLVLGARRSALGARRSALGTRHSAEDGVCGLGSRG